MIAFALFAAMGAWHTPQQEVKAPLPAPDFSAKANDGKTYTLKSLTGDKTLVLYFISWSCPVNAEAVPYYKQIQAAYKGKVNFVGVFNGDKELLAEWQKDHDVKFPILFDPEMEIIRSYKAIASPWVAVVNPKGERTVTQSGYSIARLDELNGLMSKAAGMQAAKIDTKGAPVEEAFG